MSDAGESSFIELHESWPAEPSAVPLAHASVTAFARRAGATADVLDDIRLARAQSARTTAWS